MKAKAAASSARDGVVLLRWYGRRRRDLPWRGSRDPYAVWVSEVMLQQTTVAAVIPYYKRWMTAFPDVRALAAADREDVLRLWEGLGYYTRAASLHRAAKIVIERHEGKLPDTEEELRKLPGVGAYTAAAVAAIAFGRRTVALDSLVRRVLYRYLGLSGDAQSVRNTERMRREGLALISRNRPGDGNQALMDLATAVCRPKEPLCPECPLGRSCKAYLSGTANRPINRKKTASILLEVAVGIWLRGGRAFLQKRTEKGLFAGLWELPGGKVEPGETPEEAVVREFREEIGVNVRIEKRLGEVRHGYTKFKVTLHPFIVRSRARMKENAGRRFVPLDTIGHFPQPAGNAKIWKIMNAEKGKNGLG